MQRKKQLLEQFRHVERLKDCYLLSRLFLKITLIVASYSCCQLAGHLPGLELNKVWATKISQIVRVCCEKPYMCQETSNCQSNLGTVETLSLTQPLTTLQHLLLQYFN